MTKWPVQKLTHRTTQKHVKHHDATDIKKLYYELFMNKLNAKRVKAYAFIIMYT